MVDLIRHHKICKFCKQPFSYEIEGEGKSKCSPPRKYCSIECSKKSRRIMNLELHNKKYKPGSEYKKKHNKNSASTNRKYHAKNREIQLLKQKEYRAKNRSKINEYDRKRSQTKEVKARMFSVYKIKIPENTFCEICKINKAQEKHHSDYNKPLEVEFLCIPCHRKLHSKYWK